MDKKLKKVILLTSENVNVNIPKILLGTNIDYLVILFFGKDTNENIKLLKTTQKYFKNKDNTYLKDVIIISQREYLANDLMVEAVITPADIQRFRYFDFVTRYENCHYESVEDFIESCAELLNYKYDIYNNKNPWVYHQNGTNVLVITKDSCQKILDNYHKIKCTIPEIIISVFEKRDNTDLLKLLKLIGSDAELNVTFINDLTVPYTKRSDVYIYIESEDFKNIGIDFINDVLFYTEHPEGLKTLKNYMGIPDKVFEPDIFCDDEEELERKEEKYYRLEVQNGNSLRRQFAFEMDKLIFNVGLQKKYILTEYKK